MTITTENIILCENLVKIYKVIDLEVVALQGLDLTVPRGEMLGIVGTSGSGKTTLMNILGGLDRPSAGRVLVDDIDLLSLSESALNQYQRTKVGFVWQQTGRNLIPYLTAIENIEFPMTMAYITSPKIRHEWALELLNAIGLYERRNHYLTQLSGGEQQRVAIAVALANQPILLLGDEPTGEVDSTTAQSIMETFRKLNRDFNLTTIIVTHDPRIAEQVDRVVAIRDGKISTETIRQVGQLEKAMAGNQDSGTQESLINLDTTYHEFVVLDSAGRLQIPKEVREEFGISRRVQMETTEEGILIRPVSGETETSARHLSIEEQIALLFENQRPAEKKGSQKKLRK
jgi:putative ABC transport system ATP-binding protein